MIAFIVLVELALVAGFVLGAASERASRERCGVCGRQDPHYHVQDASASPPWRIFWDEKSMEHVGDPLASMFGREADDE